MDLLTFLATNHEEGQAIFEIAINEQSSECTLKKQRESLEHIGTVSKGEYSFTTKARRKVVGRNKQLFKGTGRKTWK